MMLVENCAPVLFQLTQTSHGVRLELSPDLRCKKPPLNRVMALTVVIVV
jgi:hypothetical protein